MSQKGNREHLAGWEWGVLAVICGCLSGLLFVTYSPHPLKHYQPKLIDVNISGAVKNPGHFRVRAQATVEEAIALAEKESFADVSKLKLSKKVKQGQSIKVPMKKKSHNLRSAIV